MIDWWLSCTSCGLSSSRSRAMGTKRSPRADIMARSSRGLRAARAIALWMSMSVRKRDDQSWGCRSPAAALSIAWRSSSERRVGRERGQLRLHRRAELEDVVQLAGVLVHPLVPAPRKRGGVGHAGTTTRAARGDYVAGALQRLQRQAERHAGYSQARAQVSLGRELVVGPQLAGEDQSPQEADRAVTRRLGLEGDIRGCLGVVFHVHPAVHSFGI